MLNRDRPFVLLDDARPGALARLYSAPISIVSAETAADVQGALAELRAAQKKGLHAAGWISYEAGAAFETRLQARVHARPADAPLLWFGLFEQAEIFASKDVPARLPPPHSAWASRPRPRLSPAHYARLVERVQAYLRAGDVYQINLTFQNDIDVIGDPLALYAQMREASAAGWGGVAFDGETWLLSASPEMFFTLANGGIEMRPMKGTVRREADAAADREAARRLALDPKQQAENLMIVDLLRNDVSRVAARGSVSAPDLFTVETYPTLHTLTSSVRARLDKGKDVVDVLEALFPCGSVTGAPKIRAMEIIHELESEARGAYTGSMGWISPDGDAAFNVLIRSLVMKDGAGCATLGLGSGVVMDSLTDAEWRECLAKGAFVTAARPALQLIETIRFEPDAGIALLEQHLERLAHSARALGFSCDLEAVRMAIATTVKTLKAPRRLRLLLSPDGSAEIATHPMPARSSGVVEAALGALPVRADDFRLRHKTTSRAFYDEARAQCGAFEVVFVDLDGFVTEGSFTNVFVARDDKLATPPLRRGLLPGVLRAKLIADGEAFESDIRPEELKDGFFIGNALRGLMRAQLRREPSLS